MNREQMISWLILEGWRYHAENKDYYPVMSKDKLGYPLHMAHEGFPWGPANEEHVTSSWEDASDTELAMAMRNVRGSA